MLFSTFSITMGLAAIAPSPELFGLSRFIGGIGLGGVIPTASALTVEYSPKKAIFYLCSYVYWLSFRYRVRCYFVYIYVRRFRMEIMFGIGMIPLLLIPFIIRYLPESIQFYYHVIARRSEPNS